MLKFVVLVAFLASALACPDTDSLAKLGSYDVYVKCTRWCSPYASSKSDLATCMDNCISGEQGNRMIEYFEEEDKEDVKRDATTWGLKECLDKCKSFSKTNPIGARFCSEKCKQYQEKPVKSSGSPATYSVRDASTDACQIACMPQVLAGQSSYRDCIRKCLGGRRIAYIEEEDKEVVKRDATTWGLKECLDKCKSFSKTNPIGARFCSEKCKQYQEKPVKSSGSVPAGNQNDVSEPSFARGGKECAEDCHRRYGYSLDSLGCLAGCTNQDRSLEFESSRPIPFYIPAQQPINSETLMQVTKPIAKIVSEVLQRLQEIEQQISSCVCANKPSVPLKPFGLDVNDKGPFF